MKAAPFTWVPVRSGAEAVEVLAADEGARLLAGGQSLLGLMATRAARPTALVDLEHAGLDGVAVVDGPGGAPVLEVGSMVRQRRLEVDPVAARAAPLLADAVAKVGYVATRNSGTLGGSLAHADPVAELPAVTVALGATVVVEGPAGRRGIAAADLAAGRHRITVGHDEVLVAVRYPVAGPGHGAAWVEWSARHHDFPEVGAGVAVEVDADGTVTSARGGACGIGTVPLDIGPTLAGAGVLGASPAPGAMPDPAGSPGGHRGTPSPAPALLSAAVADAVASAAGAGAVTGADRLCGLLAVRALATAWARALAGGAR